MSAPNSPEGRRSNRKVLITIISIFVLALVAVFIWQNALIPTSRDGELNSRPVDGSQGLKPQSY